MSIVVPDACTLPTADRPLRLAEFDNLFATAVRHVETVGPTRSRMLLAGPAGLAATVRDLTARETECCSFFTFTTTAESADGGEAVTLEVEVPDRYADVLESLTRRARTMRLLVDVQSLGVRGDDLAGLTAAWRSGECTEAHRLLADAVAARLAVVQEAFADQQQRAIEDGPGSAGWADAHHAGMPLAEEAARLQAVAAALDTAPQAGPPWPGSPPPSTAAGPSAATRS